MRTTFYSFMLLLVVSFGVNGCAWWQNEAGTREKGAVIGTGVGAATGALIGNRTGHTGAGTAIGAGAGALTGGLVGEGVRRERLRTERQARAEQLAAESGQPVVESSDLTDGGEIKKTKYNPRTGQTYPESLNFDPATGEPLSRI